MYCNICKKEDNLVVSRFMIGRKDVTKVMCVECHDLYETKIQNYYKMNVKN